MARVGGRAGIGTLAKAGWEGGLVTVVRASVRGGIGTIAGAGWEGGLGLLPGRV
jgi:hypothetical protein